MIKVVATFDTGLAGHAFKGIGSGRSVEAAALNAYRDAGFTSGVSAQIVNDAGSGRYGVRFAYRVRPRGVTIQSAVWNLQIIKGA